MTIISIEKNIKKLISEEGGTMKSLIEKVGMTQSGFYKALDNETMQIKMLRRIGKELKVSVSVLLGEVDSQGLGKIEALTLENKTLKERLEDSRDLIIAYKKIINTHEQRGPEEDVQEFINIVESAYKSSYFKKVKKSDKLKFINVVKAEPNKFLNAVKKLYSLNNIDEYDIVMGDAGTEKEAIELQGKYVFAYFQKVMPV